MSVCLCAAEGLEKHNAAFYFALALHMFYMQKMRDDLEQLGLAFTNAIFLIVKNVKIILCIKAENE